MQLVYGDTKVRGQQGGRTGGRRRRCVACAVPRGVLPELVNRVLLPVCEARTLSCEEAHCYEMHSACYVRQRNGH